MKNEYIPKLSKIKEVIKHTDLEYTFRMEYDGEVKPGQFFELSIPKYGEAPISVSGIGDGLVDFTIRRVGTVTNEVFENYVGDKLFIRGPYGNGFELENYKGKELVNYWRRNRSFSNAWGDSVFFSSSRGGSQYNTNCWI